MREIGHIELDGILGAIAALERKVQASFTIEALPHGYYANALSELQAMEAIAERVADRDAFTVVQEFAGEILATQRGYATDTAKRLLLAGGPRGAIKGLVVAALERWKP